RPRWSTPAGDPGRPGSHERLSSRHARLAPGQADLRAAAPRAAHAARPRGVTAHPLRAPPAYAGGRLDRAPGLRADPARLAALLDDSATRVIPLWRDRCLLRDAVPLVLARAAAGPLTTPDRERAFLGLDGDAALFAVDLSALDETAALALADADGTADV